MRITGLTRKFEGEHLYVLGTGPSARCMHNLRGLLRGEVVLGLNQAWRFNVPTFINITVHPELYLEYDGGRFGGTNTPPPVTWAIKKKPPMENITLDDPDYYVFHTSADLKTVVERPPNTLYIGEGIQCTALDLAARMGAKFVTMIGCDATSLGGDFHAHEQHVRWLGQKPEDQYALYRKRTAQVRSVLREKFGVAVYTLSPFVGVGHPEEDYHRLRNELSLPGLSLPSDVSPYQRKKD